MKRISIFVLLITILINSTTIAVADDSSPVALGFDVIFIIDGSNSMNWEDPDRLARAAVAQFIDLSFIAGHDTRAGYVIFSDHRRANPRIGHHTLGLTDISTESGADFFVSQMMPVPSRGFTDIGWGFIAASQLIAGRDRIDGFDPSPNAATVEELVAERNANGRSPIVILLSDSNIQLRSRVPDTGIYPVGMYPRSEDLSRQNVEEVTSIFQSAGIRVHTLAFDYIVELPAGIPADLPRDPEFLEKVSTATGGLFFLIDEGPEQMISAVEDIWALELTGAAVGGPAPGGVGFQDVSKVETEDETSRFIFNIPNDSIFEAILTLRSSSPISLNQITLISPSGLPVDISHPASNMTFFQRGINTVLSMRRPANKNIESGDWTLNIIGATDAELLTVRLLYYYDLSLRLNISPVHAMQGDEVSVSAYLADPSTGDSHGQDLLLFAQSNLMLIRTDPNEIETIYPLHLGEHTFSGLEPGIHYLRTDVDMIGGLQPTENVRVAIEAFPMELYEGSIEMNIFYDNVFGLRAESLRQNVFLFEDILFSFFPGSQFTFETDLADGDDYLLIERDINGIIITALGGAIERDIHITISNQWGATANVLLSVNVNSWWDTFGIFVWIGLSIILIIFLALLFLIWRKIWENTPNLGAYKDELYINMPTTPFRIGTPEELGIVEFALRFDSRFSGVSFPGKKQQTSLYNMLRFHEMDGHPYIEALEKANVKDFIQNVKFYAKRNGSKVSLNLSVPSRKHSMVLMNDDIVPQKGRISELSYFSGECIIRLQVDPNDSEDSFELTLRVEEDPTDSGI